MSIQDNYAAALRELAHIMADYQLPASCRDKLLALGAAQQKHAEKAEAALEEIAEGLLVSSEPPPEKIVERVFRVYQIAQDACAQYTLYIGAQQKRAEKAEAALAVAEKALRQYAYGTIPWQEEKGIARHALIKIREMQGESHE